MFVNKKFVNEGLITKITKILCHENLELYGIPNRFHCFCLRTSRYPSILVTACSFLNHRCTISNSYNILAQHHQVIATSHLYSLFSFVHLLLFINQCLCFWCRSMGKIKTQAYPEKMNVGLCNRRLDYLINEQSPTH